MGPTHFRDGNITFYHFVFVLALGQYDNISESMFASNFVEFNAKAKKAMLLLMHVTGARPKKIQPSSIVRFELSLEMFLKVCRQTGFIHSNRT